jgi:hypothetical protein
MAVLPTGIGPVTGGYQIERSLRFNSADTAYLNRTPGSAGNRRIFTFSAWIKRSQANALVGIMGAGVNADSTQTDFVGFDGTNGNSLLANFGDGTYPVTTAAVLRDFSAWYHIVFAIDTTQATNTNRVKIYLNGIQQTLSGTYPPQNYDSAFNTTNFHTIGSRSRLGAASNYLNGYLTEVNFINGQVPTTTTRTVNGVTETILTQLGEFNSSTGVWTPKAWDGTYGTNGFYLNFSDNSGTTSTTLGKDSSGNGNNWTPNNFSVTAGSGNDSLVDSPTAYGTDTGVGGEVRGNYATLNPLENRGLTLSNGNLNAAYSPAAWQSAKSTFSMTSGKWYFEATLLETWSNGMLGVYPTSSALASDGLINNAYAYQTDGRIWSNKTVLTTTSSFSSGDTIMCAIDIDAGKLWFGRNGTWYNSGAPASGTNATYTGLSGAYSPATSIYNASSGLATNFGQRAFAYTAPSGFKALCTQNLPTPTIGATSTTQANDYFNAVLYTGNGSNGKAVTGVGFQPDAVWAKCRSNSYHHFISDAVRTAAKVLSPSQTAAESSWSDNSHFASFDSDGFTLNSNSGVNANAETYVAWNWNAGGSNATNTSGTITSTVRANTTSGFSIVTYTGNFTASQTVGHGLSTAPVFIITKRRDSTSDWGCIHPSLAATQIIRFNLTGAAETNDWFANTRPTSSVFYVGQNSNTNPSGGTMVAYVFAPVAGYSAFGSYTGNGSTDGPFVYTGFAPKYVLVKSSSEAGQGWIIADRARSTYNVSNQRLRAETSDAEGTDNGIDFLSNGFKVRTTNWNNTNGQTQIYAAFAESPFKYSLAR